MRCRIVARMRPTSPERTLCPVLIGREHEFALFEEALRAAQGSEGHLVMVGGDAGVGKTRLVADFARKAASAGVPILVGGCAEMDLRVPYLPFVEAIRKHLRQTRGAQTREAVDAVFGATTTRDGDPAQRQLHTFEGVLRLLEDLSLESALVLILEDLHWSDAATRDLLDYLARSLPGSRLLVLGTYRLDEVERNHPLSPLIRGWLSRGLATSVELRPLSPAGVEGMLEATMGPHEPDLAARLHQRSEGNPFVLEEMLKTGSEGRIDQPLPPTVRDAILSRVERLPARHLQVLRAAAVLGDQIDDAILVDLLGDGVAEALEACTRQQFLTTGPDGAYAWRHALTREAVYDEMAPVRRRELHAAVADLYEARIGMDDVAVGRHLAAAGRWDEALPRLRRTAGRAVAMGAFADGADLLEMCLPHVVDPSQRAELLEELAELLIQSGAPHRGERFAREALGLRESAGRVEATARARRTLAVCLWQQVREAEAMGVEDQAIAELESIAPSPTLVAALARRASWSLIGEADIPAALAGIARARRLATEHAFDPDLYSMDEGQVLASAGPADEGLAILDRGWGARLRSSEGRGSDWREAKFMLHHAAAIRNLLGRTSEALATLSQSPTPAATQDAAETSLAVVRIEALWAHGEVMAARRLAASLDLRRIEPVLVPVAQCIRAQLLLASGQRAAAVALARTAMPPHWQPIGQLWVAGLVRLLVAAGEVTDALGLVPRLRPLSGYGIELRLPFLDAAVEAYLAGGLVDLAAELAAEAEVGPADHPARLRVEARMLLARGLASEALPKLRRSIEGSVRVGHRQDEWHTRRLVARALRDLGRRAEAQAELRHVDEEMAAADGPAASPGTGLEPALSVREREVALLVARGLKNREIAERLVISERTVENHIHRALERTGFRSRAELAARITTLSGGLSTSPE